MPRKVSEETEKESCTGATQEVTEGQQASTVQQETETQAETTESVQKHLVAVSHILFEAHQYKPGEVLPAHDQKMNELWLNAGTARWMSDTRVAGMAATQLTAQPGLSGRAVPQGEDDLAGRPPRLGR